MDSFPLKTALLIPAVNEEPVIEQTLRTVPEGLFNMIIVADNGSSDKTAEIARRNGAIVVHAPRRGYGIACLTALAALPPEIGVVVFLQADLSEDPAEAHKLVE